MRSSPAKLDPARAGLDEPGGRPQQGRLARPVGAEQGDHLAVAHGEVDVAQHHRVAVAGGDRFKVSMVGSTRRV